MGKNIVLALFVTATLFSCQSWLDVQPKTEIKLDKLFNSETGFKNALIGCYLLMSEPSLYGREMNVTFMDVLAQQYEMKDENSYGGAKKYYYADYENTISTMWNSSYKIIANLNAILGEIDGRKNILHPTTYGYIKGEALGLRAFLHFDLLRMFGPGGLDKRADKLNILSIPYVKSYNKHLTKQSSTEDVLRHIEADLYEAEKLLEYYDIYDIVTKKPDFIRPSDLFFDTQKRRSRFNYLAVKATQARMYMWWGKYDKALECTKVFTKTDDALIPWVNINEDIANDVDKRDFRIMREQIFRLDVYKFYDNIKQYTEKYTKNENFSDSENKQYFYHSMKRSEETFEATTVGLSDFRYSDFYNMNDVDRTFLKFYQSETCRAASLNKMPIIKKSEMYYIAAECLLRHGDNIGAIKLLNEVRVNRGIKYEHNLPNNIESEQIKIEIEKEYRKEFIGEGVMFFFYKRLNEVIPNSMQPVSDKIFIFPLPENEVETGNREGVI